VFAAYLKTARKTGAVEMRHVIVAKSPIRGSAFQYFSGDGFKANPLQAARFRTEEDARRRSEKSIPCRRMQESGARIEVRRVTAWGALQGIMQELHVLAARMGTLPVSQRRAALRGDAPLNLRSDAASRPPQAAGEKQWPTFPTC
jgi:hypothetical protein